MRTEPVCRQSAGRVALCLLTLFIAASTTARAATQQGGSPDRQRAMEAWEKQNFVEAVPLLEKLSAESPNDIGVLSKLGFALYASTAAVKDPEARKQVRDHARTVLLRSNELGDDSNLTRMVLEAHNLHSAIVVTSPYHARRAKMTFDAAYAGSGIEVTVHSAPDSQWRKQSWWQRAETRRLTFTELQKLGYIFATGQYH